MKLCYTKALEWSSLVPGPEVKSSSLEIMNLTPFTVSYHYDSLNLSLQESLTSLCLLYWVARHSLSCSLGEELWQWSEWVWVCVWACVRVWVWCRREGGKTNCALPQLLHPICSASFPPSLDLTHTLHSSMASHGSWHCPLLLPGQPSPPERPGREAKICPWLAELELSVWPQRKRQSPLFTSQSVQRSDAIYGKLGFVEEWSPLLAQRMDTKALVWVLVPWVGHLITLCSISSFA